MSKQLRSLHVERRDVALLRAFEAGKTSISDDLIFPAPEGNGILDPDNLYKRYFLPVIEHSGLRRFRLHDLRHTFGSLLIQSGASLKYVSEQMGHSTIELTAKIHCHLIPGADISWIDRLDTNPATSAHNPHTLSELENIPSKDGSQTTHPVECPA